MSDQDPFRPLNEMLLKEDRVSISHLQHVQSSRSCLQAMFLFAAFVLSFFLALSVEVEGNVQCLKTRLNHIVDVFQLPEVTNDEFLA